MQSLGLFSSSNQRNLLSSGFSV
uniref:Uncharacterized protein n=1 Tax=Arundo donax TaxID=35708 RepID=A0A0A8YP22_ARUDO